MPSYSTRSPFQPGLEAQVNFMSELTRTTSDSVRKLSELNLHFAQQLMQDTFDAGSRMLACTNPLQLVNAASQSAQPAFEHLRSYQQQLVRLLSGSQIDLARTAPAFLPEATRYARDMASTMAREESADNPVTASP